MGRRAAMVGGLLVVSLWMSGCAGGAPDSTRFEVGLAPGLEQAVSGGRLYVLLSPGAESEPLFTAPHEQKVLAVDVERWSNTDSVILGAGHDAWPYTADELPAGEYAVRAVLDHDTDDWRTGWAPGNLYSSKAVLEIGAGPSPALELVVEHTVPHPEFAATDRIHEVRLKSAIVSAFAQGPRFIEAAVILPAGYATGTERYPVVFVLPGWGATHHSASQGDFQQRRYGMDGFGRDKVFVFLNHDMSFGAHCFANSDTVGPWGDALVTEFIPFLEERYRIIHEPEGRFLVGQSSGGWGALWLQITYPTVFSGAFAGSPDFVDFRAFGPHLDLYEPGANFFAAADGTPHPGVRDSETGTTLLTNRQGVERSAVVRGANQQTSFEAVFGMPTPGGGAERLFDPSTGTIDPDVVARWSRFDLTRRVAEQWPRFGQNLQGKLTIWVGDEDDYYLDEAVRLFAETLEDLDAAAHIEIIPDAGHDTWSDDVRGTLHRRIDASLQRAGL
jgi:S-formylglutathione hydrolase FrmB